MPIYSYECKCCKLNFDLLEKREVLDDDNFKAQCPKCESFETQKVVSSSSFMLKGSGWAKDSYGLKQHKGE